MTLPKARLFWLVSSWRICALMRSMHKGAELHLDFQDHRHDQAALSLIAYREGAPFLDYSARGLFRILRLRPQSALAHHFLKRIDDAEAMERGEMIRGLVRSFRTLRAARGEARRHG